MENLLIASELKRILSFIENEPSVERAFLFRSAVDPNRLRADSDIDLCIVQRTKRRFYDRLAEWIDRMQPEVGLDLVVYTPEEFTKLSRGNYFVRTEIQEKGKEIYHAA